MPSSPGQDPQAPGPLPFAWVATPPPIQSKRPQRKLGLFAYAFSVFSQYQVIAGTVGAATGLFLLFIFALSLSDPTKQEDIVTAQPIVQESPATAEPSTSAGSRQVSHFTAKPEVFVQSARQQTDGDQVDKSLPVLIAESRSKLTDFHRDTGVADLIARVKPAVVRIETQAGEGSGVVVDTAGLVATNMHVLSEATEAFVEFSDGRRVKVEGVLDIDESRDIAILKLVPSTVRLVALPLADMQPRDGEGVIAIGAPLGLGFTSARGIVSAVRSGDELTLWAQSIGEQVGRRRGSWIQTDAFITHGNSGGPLIGLDGVVIGLNTFGLKGHDLNFAISAIDVQAAVVRSKHSKPLSLAQLNRKSAVTSDSRLAVGSVNVLTLLSSNGGNC